MKISLQLVDTDLKDALNIAAKYGIYAYDSYFIVATKRYNAPLVTLDKELNRVAKSEKLKT